MSDLDATRSDERVYTPAVVHSHEGGLYDLPVVGAPLQRVREFYDDMAPDEDDSVGVRAGKQVIRYGTVAAAGVGAAGVAAVLVL